MNRVATTFVRLSVFSLFLAVLAGCNSLSGGSSLSNPTITSFIANPAVVTAGGSASLTAVFSGGTGVVMPGNISVTSGKAVSVTPAKTTTYILTVTNTTGGTATQEVTVAVTPLAPTITSFTANPTTITAGGSATLTGIFANGSGVITPGNIAATSATAVTVSPTATTTYTLTVTNSAAVTASMTATVTVLTAQTITFANPGTQTVGTPLTLSATATSGLTVSFASTTPSVCTVSGATATFLTAGTCSITASQAGNATYAAATPVSQSFTVNASGLLAQTITFANPGSQTVGTPLTLVATATSGLPVSFTSTTTSVCTVSGTTAIFLIAGTCSITASQPGNATYAAAMPVSQSFPVIATTGGSTVGYSSCPAPAGSGVTYTIGMLNSSSQPTGPQTIADFTHWNSLNPGDVVCIYGKSTPYAERLVLTRSGSDEQHRIRIVGVNQGGYDPILTGKSATTAAAFNYGANFSQYFEGGEVSVTGLNYGTPVAYLNIEGLTIQGATTAEVAGTVASPTYSSNTYSDPNINSGAQSPWGCGSAGINLLRSDHISIIHNRIKDNDNGIFVNSNNGNTSSNILVESNHIYGNGVFGEQQGAWNPGKCGADAHGTYSEAENITYLGNRFGALRQGEAVNLLKDRSSGLVVAYNLFLPDGVFEASLGDALLVGSKPGSIGHLLDLVESYDTSVGPAGGLQSLGAAYNNVSVYGNIFFDDGAAANGSQGAENAVHFGGDQGNSAVYRKHLHYYNNTVVARRADGVGWLEMEPTTDAGAWNNIFYAAYVGSSTPPSFNLLSTWCYDKQYGYTCGTVNYLAQNWNSPIWAITGVNGSNSNPNFVSLTNYDVHIATNDPAIVGNGQTGDSAYPANSTTIPIEYSDFLSTVTRPFSQAKIDLGALGYSATALQSQTITFANPGPQTVGTPLTLIATASSGLPVSFASQTTSVCTVSGTTATFLTTGTCTIQATQSGNSTYAAATPVTQSFTVNAALIAQTITFANPGPQTVGTPLTLVATASSGLPVSFTSTTTGVCTVSGNTATFLAAGACSITATQPGNATYAAATPVSQSFTVSGAPLSNGTPLILYTDLLSGPTSGGENNNGTYLSIFGQNFGASGLGTTTKVYIGGVEVASYRFLGASLGRPDIQQITVQVGALSGLAQGTAYPISVQVNGVNSTSYTAQTFTPNPGRILFVSLGGNDATAAVNDINHPWGDIQASTWDSSHSSGAYGAWGAAHPGDVIVFRGGTYTMQGFNDSGNKYFCKFFYGPLGSAPTGIAGTGPIAITAYPNESVVIQPPQSTTYGVFDGVNSQYYVDGNNNPTMSQWITFSNLKVVGGTEDGPINLNVMSNHWRVVNTDLSNPASAANAGGVSGDGNYIEVLGNNIHDIGGNSSLQDHGIYLDSGANYELAYNVIGNITGGNGIQTYNSGDATPNIDNVNIHHNIIHGIAKHGINIADTTRNGVSVWSNVVYNTAAGCLRFNTTDIAGARIWNNTFYNCNTNGNYAAIMNDWNITSGAISFTNNIVWPASASGQYLGGSVGFSPGEITGNKNQWYNGTDNSDVSFDAHALFTNPLFVSTSTPDFHLQSASPAMNSGDTSVSTLVTSNYDASPRPDSSGYYDRGALGSSATTLLSQTITFANPGPQTVGTPLTLVATASSGLPVSFTSQTMSVCTVSSATATFLTTGTCSITASQAGNATYAAATPVSQSFTVNPAPAVLITSITIPSATTVAVGATTTITPIVLPVNATDKTLTWNSSDTTIATVSAAGVVTGIQQGTVIVTAIATDGSGVVSNDCTVTVTEATTTQSNYFGINIGSDLDWETNRVFADAMKSSRAWGTTSDAGATLPTSALDANGWPTQDASLYVWAGIGQMQGTYALSFNGQATVVPSSGTIANKAYNSTTNLTTATLAYTDTDSNSYLTLTFTNTKRTQASGTNSGITNVALMRPSAVGSTTPLASTQVFNPPFLAALSNFAVLRTMDFSATNGNEIVHWSDRTRPGDASQAIGNPSAPAGGWEGPGGAWEYAILLANQTSKDLWINVPLNADDDYITKLAQLMRYGSDGTTPYTSAQTSPVWPGLNSNLHLYVEFSNEVWNTAGAFAGTENHTEAVAEVNAGDSPLNFDGDTNDWYWAWRRPAEKTVQISTIFRSVWGDAAMMTTVRPVLESQLGYADGPLLQAMHLMVDYYDNPTKVSSPQPPGYYIYGLGGSGYYGPTDLSSVNSIFSTMASGFVSAVQSDVDYALPFGLRRIAYEGGPSLDSTGDNSKDANQAAAWADSRMEQVIVTEQNAWSQANGDLLVYFYLAGGYQWGFMSDVLSPASPKMSGIADILASPRSASTYGTPIPATLNASSANVPPAWLWSDGSNTRMHDYKWTGFSVLVSTQAAFTVSLTADSATSGAQAEILVDGNSIGTVTVPSAGNTSALSTSTLSAGSHGILVRSLTGSFNLVHVVVQSE